MRAPVLGRICSSYILCSALAVASPAARNQAPMFEDSAAGVLLRVDSGKLVPLPDATVTLRCDGGSEAGEDNHFRSSCDSVLEVKRAGKRIAMLDHGIGGIDFEAVGGNQSSLKLSLLPLDGDASLVAVRVYTREGDEESREKEEEQLFAVEGKTLRELYRWQPLSAYDPGPDGNAEDRRRTTAELRQVARGRLLLERDGDTTTLAWDGKQLGEVKAPAGDSPVGPLVARVLAGKRLAAGELVGLSADALQKLRNAPYARHGRPFKNPELQRYFYRERKPNPAFKELMLDADDRYNLALVLAEIKKR